MTWYGTAPSKVRATKPVSTGRQHGSSQDQDMRDDKVWESLHQPIQHCNDCGAPMQSLCICLDHPGEKFSYNSDITPEDRERLDHARARKEAARLSAAIKHCIAVTSVPECDRPKALLKVPINLRETVAQMTNTEW